MNRLPFLPKEHKMATAIDFAALLKAERAARRAEKTARKTVARVLTPNVKTIELTEDSAVGEGKVRRAGGAYGKDERGYQKKTRTRRLLL